ncbi:hypothetical protein SBA5_970005 [Candidatus Sulfotelmatomonas gaucii]|uniref:Uncharacterized protein n=1 Tax=Candidatus Sulfuritelmatomonas gaucii TaxID=2043161 RepID=A0A2N9M9W9_9BACT|nr:hypothetical protein SBA5_970005 [Candidatus Sulfotelmatomonas gaucii]
MSSEAEGKIATGGEADNTDTMGIETPLGRMGAYDAHGLLAVGGDQRRHLIDHWLVAAGYLDIVRRREEAGIGFGEPVAEKKRGDAERVEETRDIHALGVDRERTIAAAGTDDDRGSIGAAGGREVGRQRGIDDVVDPVLPVDIRIRFLLRPVFRARDLARPEAHLLGRGGKDHGAGLPERDNDFGSSDSEPVEKKSSGSPKDRTEQNAAEVAQQTGQTIVSDLGRGTQGFARLNIIDRVRAAPAASAAL